jgi:uncharacterized membrane protein HdeD (DUF308 family)
MASFILDLFARNWWLWLARGIFAVAFGVMAFALPELTLQVLVLLFGIYAVADGVTALWLGAVTRAWWLILLGVLAIGAGIATFIRPEITAVALLYLIAAWAIARGIFEIVTAIELRKVIDNEWLLALAGAISIAFGFMLAANREAGALAVVWIIGAYATAVGAVIIILAFRLRALIRRIKQSA